MTQDSALEVFGYVEGYYGRLLTWDERASLVDELAAQGFNTYFYGPKDDAKHRMYWREGYSESWRTAFRLFTRYAHQRGVAVIAGLAPGLDFDFAGLDTTSNGIDQSSIGQIALAATSSDYRLLQTKAQLFVDDGANAIGLMMDDIDADFRHRSGEFDSEGAAHATLANRLQQDLNFAPANNNTYPRVFCVPRIYANELLQESDLTMPAVSGSASSNETNDSDAAEYMRSFTDCLRPEISWLYCGTHVVARQPDKKHCVETGARPQHRIVIWDNFYANDYCPRRLFLGAWTGRETCSELLLNGTGLPHTDRLLLRVVAAINSLTASGSNKSTTTVEHAWRHCLLEAGVPEQFFRLQEYFASPVFSDSVSGAVASEKDLTGAYTQSSLPLIERQIAAIDHLLWRWKAPLAREWYPYLFGLKQDLMIANGTLPGLRIRKTQTPALAGFLESLKTSLDH